MQWIGFRFCRRDGESTPAFRRRALRILGQHHIILPDDIESVLYDAIDDEQVAVTMFALPGPCPPVATVYRPDADAWVN